MTGDAGTTISWTAATDDVGVAGYYVYRWTDAPAGAGYTPVPARVATVTTGTSYADTGLTNGTTYHYYVRAYDAATNVGPRFDDGGRHTHRRDGAHLRRDADDGRLGQALDAQRCALHGRRRRHPRCAGQARRSRSAAAPGRW